MKLIINQDTHIKETEIVINCSYVDNRLEKLNNYIRQYTFSLECESDGSIYQLPLEEIFYMETVDGKTFLYTQDHTYSCRQSLTTLEDKVRNTPLIRISKSCILNVSHLKCVAPFVNHRLKAELTNGEHLIISRNYIDALKAQLRK
ncbi:MAG: LytTR family transcriptional regulator [Lachnospiraceae bacterium]|nr:LytTR family transcriptional regulator [Lachnospiraceae bacterium]